MTVMMMASYAAMAGDMVCWFAPKTEGAKAKAMAEALSKSGNNITPRVATSYGEIVEAMAKPEPQLVFVGSFTQAMLAARATGTPIVQGVDGKELYSGILIYPEGQSPTDILTSSPADISFAIGASSGESSAKAATGGKASIGVTNHELMPSRPEKPKPPSSKIGGGKTTRRNSPAWPPTKSPGSPSRKILITFSPQTRRLMQRPSQISPRSPKRIRPHLAPKK